MRRNTRKPKLTFPESFSGNAVAVCVEVEMIPLLCGLLRKWEGAEPWADDENWQKGYQWVTAFQECLMASCLSTGIQTMIDEQRRLYRLLDSVLNGTQYTTVAFGDIGGGGGTWGGGGGGGGTWGEEGGGGDWGSTEDGEIIQVPGEEEPSYYLVEPPLPAAPPDYTTVPPVAPALRARIERLEHLLDNLANGRTYLTDDQNPNEEPLDDDISIRERIRLMQGEINEGWFGIGGEDATLADIIEALGSHMSMLEAIRDKLIEADPQDDSLLEEIRKLLR